MSKQQASVDVLEGNKLIAEFMGKAAIIYECECCGKDVRDAAICNGDEEGFTRSHALGGLTVNLHYHESWSWIMPVVEKISKIKIDWEDAEYNDTYYPRTFGMISPSGNPMVRINANQVFEAPTLIEATWIAVVDFIKWYNQNKQS